MAAPLRIGLFLSDRLLPLYEASAAATREASQRETELVTQSEFGALARGELDLAFLCGLPYVDLRDGGADVEPLVAPVAAGERYGGRPVYFSDVIARAGAGRRALEGEPAGRLGVNEPESHSGWSIVMATLAERGVPIDGYDEVIRTGGHEASMAAVREGRADVAAVDSHVLATMDEAATDGLEVIEALGPSPSQPLAAGPTMGPEERNTIRAALLDMPPTTVAPNLTITWAPVTDATYDPIRAMRDRARERGAF